MTSHLRGDGGTSVDFRASHSARRGRLLVAHTTHELSSENKYHLIFIAEIILYCIASLHSPKSIDNFIYFGHPCNRIVCHRSVNYSIHQLSNQRLKN